MNLIIPMTHRIDRALITTARSSQALAIAFSCRLLSTPRGWPTSPLGSVVRLELALARSLLDDPAKFLDGGYDLLERLLALHREFAARLFEVVQPRDLEPDGALNAPHARVLPFVARTP